MSGSEEKVQTGGGRKVWKEDTVRGRREKA